MSVEILWIPYLLIGVAVTSYGHHLEDFKMFKQRITPSWLFVLVASTLTFVIGWPLLLISIVNGEINGD